MRTHQVPPGARERLVNHYGPSVDGWLHHAPELIDGLARDWGLTVRGYHDAGWTSLLVTCQQARRTYLLKVTPDPDRYAREHAALTHWAGKAACAITRADAVRQAFLLPAVGDTPGGITRPDNHAHRVAAELPRLHFRAAPDAARAVPLLNEHYRAVVEPRIRERLRRLPHHLDEAIVNAVLGPDVTARCSRGTLAMLHADLYAENIPFDMEGRPVFVDPHPMRGPAAYDWAFWSVYYAPEGFVDRLELCRATAAAPIDDVVAHAAVLALDGYLFYLDTGDIRAADIRDALHLAVDQASTGAR